MFPPFFPPKEFYFILKFLNSGLKLMMLSAAAGVLEWSKAKRKNEAIAKARNTPVLRSKMPEKN